MTKYEFADLDKWAKKSKNRMLAIAQTATQDVIDEAQKPVGKGGNMRVDTGFLRATGQASLDGLPLGPSNAKDDGLPNEQDTNLVIGQATLGDTIFFGWTANYARYRESKDAFLGLAVQKWQQFVDRATRQAKSRFK